MHFYSETHESTLRMPLQTFWMLSNNIDRIQAQLDLRTLALQLKSGMNATEESVGEIYESLIAETGEIVKMTISAKSLMNAPRDEVGFAALKAMAQ